MSTFDPYHKWLGIPSHERPIDLYRLMGVERFEEDIEVIEDCLGIKAEKNLLPMQPGDVPDTWADTADLAADVGYQPSTPIEEGVKKFVDWYLEFYSIELEKSA